MDLRKRLKNGAQTTIHVALKTEESGKFFEENEISTKITDLAQSKEIAKDLWDWSEQQCLKHSDYFKKFLESN